MADRVIHKDRLAIFSDTKDYYDIRLPVGAKILRLSKQYPGEESPYIWYSFDPSTKASETVRIHMVGTGQAFEDTCAEYLGTEIFHNGSLVLHFFKERS